MKYFKKEAGLSFKIPKKNYVDFKQLEDVTKGHLYKNLQTKFDLIDEIKIVSKMQQDIGASINLKAAQDFAKRHSNITNKINTNKNDILTLERVPKVRLHMN